MNEVCGHVPCPACASSRPVTRVDLAHGGQGLHVSACECGIPAHVIDPWEEKQ